VELNQVTLPALDLTESIDYYTRFGLKLIVDSPEDRYARFEIPGGASTLSLHVVDRRVREPAPHISFETAQPEQRVAELAARGIEPVEPLEVKSWLWREAWYVDPAGNRLCIYFAGENRRNPPWRVKG
jgi:catechol 2,3-dioxygenase-like lactoylglutathione lyase family enzyme